MKSGSELVRLGLRTFFENAAEDLEKTFENLKLGKFTHSRSQMKGVSQNINYTTVALLPILTALFEHITQHHFGVDLLRESPRRRSRFNRVVAVLTSTYFFFFFPSGGRPSVLLSNPDQPLRAGHGEEHLCGKVCKPFFMFKCQRDVGERFNSRPLSLWLPQTTPSTWSVSGHPGWSHARRLPGAAAQHLQSLLRI